jgi:hypothetical protein
MLNLSNSSQFLLNTEWHLALVADEIPILATTAGVFNQRGLVLTSKRLLVIRTGARPPENAFGIGDLSILRSDSRNDRIVVRYRGQAHEFKAIKDGIDELIAGVEALQANGLTGYLRWLNEHPQAYRVSHLNEGPFDKILFELDEADRDRRSVGVHVSSFGDDGRFLPALEQEMKEINRSDEPHEDYTTFPLYVVQDALEWHAKNGEHVEEGDVIARYAGEPVKAPASGRLEHINLEHYIERHHDGYYSDEYMFEVGLWALDGKIGRIFSQIAEAAVEVHAGSGAPAGGSMPDFEPTGERFLCHVCGGSQALWGDCHVCGHPLDEEDELGEE